MGDNITTGDEDTNNATLLDSGIDATVNVTASDPLATAFLTSATATAKASATASASVLDIELASTDEPAETERTVSTKPTEMAKPISLCHFARGFQAFPFLSAVRSLIVCWSCCDSTSLPTVTLL